MASKLLYRYKAISQWKETLHGNHRTKSKRSDGFHVIYDNSIIFLNGIRNSKKSEEICLLLNQSKNTLNNSICWHV